MTDESSPLVTVVVPLYNYEKYIGDCIRSIQNQTHRNWELIVIDDCSTDKSRKIVQSLMSDDRIRMITYDKNRGYSFAKNQGLLASSGEFITTLDADDMMTEDSIMVRVQHMVSDHVDLVHANAIAVYDDVTLEECYRYQNLDDWTKKVHLKKSPTVVRCPSPYNIHAQSVMVRRNVYQKFGLYDEGLRSRADREMWWRLLGQSENDEAKIPYEYLDWSVAYYRYHSASMMTMRSKKKKYDKKVRKLATQAYKMRRKGITPENTKFLAT